MTTKQLVVFFVLLFNLFILKCVHTKCNFKKITNILICFLIVLFEIEIVLWIVLFEIVLFEIRHEENYEHFICCLNCSFEKACTGNIATKELVVFFVLLSNLFILKCVHTKGNFKKITNILICFWIVLIEIAWIENVITKID